MANFLEWLKIKRSKNRQDIFMEQLKSHAGNQIWDLTDSDVAWKDTNNSGRILMHHKRKSLLRDRQHQQMHLPIKYSVNTHMQQNPLG